MSAWKLALAALCGVGFFKQLDFLGTFQDLYFRNGPYNLTEEELEYQVFPVFSYSYICVILILVAITDLVYYKPIISLGILALIFHSALITWGRGVLVTQLASFTSGFSAATNIAYFSYAFAVVEPERYRMASGCSRAALLFGILFGNVVGEILVYVFDTEYFVLNCATLGFMCFAVVMSVFIPSAVLSSFQQVIERELQSPDNGHFQNQIAVPVNINSSVQTSHIQGETTGKRSDISIIPRMNDALNISQESLAYANGPMFYDIDTSSLGFSYNDMMSECSDMSSLDRTRLEDAQVEKEEETIKEKLVLSVNSVKETFSSISVIIWSAFWIVLTFVDFQVAMAIRPFLDQTYSQRDSFHLDGAVESVSLFLGAVLVLLVAFVKVNLTRWANSFFLLGVASLVQGVFVTLIAVGDGMWITICMYAGCRILYQVCITVAMFKVATEVTGRRFAFVFGINMVISGALELVFTGVRAGDKDTAFPFIAQFAVYAAMLGLLGLFLLVKAVHSFIQRIRSGSEVQDDLDTLVQD